MTDETSLSHATHRIDQSVEYLRNELNEIVSPVARANLEAALQSLNVALELITRADKAEDAWHHAEAF